ncbi:helix-turn-helix domain-containing protein [Devosia faecipullorum]|uniref:helix-turn-helix domain-containing protein n=1 Tax=Devosia faecipullorum TaxID=2755039 RepID=UPI002EDA0B21
MNSGCASASEPRAALFAAASSADRAATLVARDRMIHKPLLFNPSRCRADAARARQLAMYLTHVVLGQSLTAVGIAFGRDRTTVSYACALIEDMRDDPHFDEDVSRLEALLENGDGLTNA